MSFDRKNYDYDMILNKSVPQIGDRFLTHRGLDCAWVQHNSNRLSNGSRRKVLLELRTDVPAVSMSGDNTSPHNAILAHLTRCVLLRFLSLVDVRYALAHVIGSVLPVLETINLQTGLAAVLVASVTLVTQMDGVAMKSDRFGHCVGWWEEEGWEFPRHGTR